MRKKSLEGWDSECLWYPLLEKGYGHHFDKCCNQYPHYLETAIHYMYTFSHDHQHIRESCNTAIEEYLFSPKGFYVDTEVKKPVVFDYGCTIAMIPSQR